MKLKYLEEKFATDSIDFKRHSLSSSARRWRTAVDEEVEQKGVHRRESFGVRMEGGKPRNVASMGLLRARLWRRHENFSATDLFAIDTASEFLSEHRYNGGEIWRSWCCFWSKGKHKFSFFKLKRDFYIRCFFYFSSD